MPSAATWSPTDRFNIGKINPCLALFVVECDKDIIVKNGDGVYKAVNQSPAGVQLARVLLPEIQAFFESEDGQREIC